MERDAVCRGQYHGWTKETIGGHIVRRCHIHHCEQTGIVGRMGGVFSVIEDNHIHHINNMQELAGAEVAGIKLHAAIDVTIRRNHFIIVQWVSGATGKHREHGSHKICFMTIMHHLKISR